MGIALDHYGVRGEWRAALAISALKLLVHPLAVVFPRPPRVRAGSRVVRRRTSLRSVPDRHQRLSLREPREDRRGRCLGRGVPFDGARSDDRAGLAGVPRASGVHDARSSGPARRKGTICARSCRLPPPTLRDPAQRSYPIGLCLTSVALSLHPCLLLVLLLAGGLALAQQPSDLRDRLAAAKATLDAVEAAVQLGPTSDDKLRALRDELEPVRNALGRFRSR